MRHSWTRIVSRTFALAALLLGPSAVWAQQREDEPRNETSQATELSEEERQSLRSLANGRFMSGDTKGALDALNRIGEPRVGSIKVEGLVRTRRSLVHEYLGLKPGELLTAEKLGRIKRRLEEFPSASYGTVRYDAIAGSALVTPIVSERERFPSGLFDWAPVAGRAIFTQDIQVDIANALEWGEVISPSYRFRPNRPRAMLELDAPSPGILPGVLHLETMIERQSYQHPSLGIGMFREDRFRVGAAMSDWLSSWFRWQGGAAFDHIGFGDYVAFEGSLNTRAIRDHLAVILTGGQWYAVGAGNSFVAGEVVITARSTTEPGVPVVTTLVGISVASKMAPLAIWPGATSGSGQGRGALLRAHPLVRGGIVTGDVFGRQLIFSSTEYEHPIPNNFGALSVAGFVDIAEAGLRLDPRTSSQFQVDVGGGVRFNTSRNGNKVRLDFGYGLRDGRTRLSAGYVLPWGTR